jgi:cytoskeleton protein RodZ
MGEGVSGQPTANPSATAQTAPTATQAVVPPPAEQPLPQGQVYGDTTKPVRVVLRAREATRILIQGPDGRVYQNRLLKPGDSYRLPNIPGLTLTTPNAGVVDVSLDGTPMGTAGHSQETIEALSLDAQSIQDRYNGNHH